MISEPGWRGWQAIERGHHVKLVQANHAFLAMHLTRGEHDLLLAYRPRSFATSGAISIVSAIACA